MSHAINFPRPFRAVQLPGGGAAHVRSITIAEMRRCDREAEAVAPGPDREIRRTQVLAAFALAGADGAALFPVTASDADGAAIAAAVADLEALTPDQLGAIVEAALPSKDDAKKS